MKKVTYICSILMGTISIVGFVFTVYPFTDIMKNCIISYPMLIIVILIILLLTTIIGWALFLYSKNITRSANILQGLKPANNNQKRYSIVFVDDMFKKLSIRNDYKDKLATYDILLLSEVTNIRLLAGFDIIILDIIGAGGILGDTKVLIEEMRETYPYKYIIVFTNNTCGLGDAINKFCHVVQKPSTAEDTVSAQKALIKNTVDTIQEQLRIAFEKLDSPERYWNEIKGRFPLEKKDSIKKKFEHYVLDSDIYTQSVEF